MKMQFLEMIVVFGRQSHGALPAGILGIACQAPPQKLDFGEMVRNTISPAIVLWLWRIELRA
jgi:hypothetical protein